MSEVILVFSGLVCFFLSHLISFVHVFIELFCFRFIVGLKMFVVPMR